MSLCTRANKEYQDLIPPISQEDNKALEDDIIKNGLYYPIVRNEKGIILDGHNRERICVLHNIPRKYEVKKFRNPLEEKVFVIHSNLKRRHLTEVQKIEIGHKLKPIYDELARKNSLANLKNSKRSTASNDALGRVSKRIATGLGLSTTTYERGEKVMAKAPKLWSEVMKGKMSVNKAYWTMKREQKKASLIAEASESKELPENVSISCGDFVIESTKIRGNSIDLIFTDPPYSRKDLSLYEKLASVAARVLKPGGSVVFNVGHGIIPEVINSFLKAGLSYHWILAIKMGGKFARVFGRKVVVKQKPLLWFRKGDSLNVVEYIDDFIESRKPKKEHHKWEQSEIEARHVISRLTVERQIVYDPMMGSGTTGEVAKKLGRKFIGHEIDRGYFENAKPRLS
jgi:hypothetical protein